MQVKTYGSRFQLLMAARNGSARIIRFATDGSDAGLYLSGFRNQGIGTPLAARGPVEQLENLLHDLRA